MICSDITGAKSNQAASMQEDGETDRWCALKGKQAPSPAPFAGSAEDEWGDVTE